MIIISVEERDYISLTDMANAKEDETPAAYIINNRIRAGYTLIFLKTREQINNPDFKVVEFDHFKMQQVYPILCIIYADEADVLNAVWNYSQTMARSKSGPKR